MCIYTILSVKNSSHRHNFLRSGDVFRCPKKLPHFFLVPNTSHCQLSQSLIFDVSSGEDEPETNSAKAARREIKDEGPEAISDDIMATQLDEDEGGGKDFLGQLRQTNNPKVNILATSIGDFGMKAHLYLKLKIINQIKSI